MQTSGCLKLSLQTEYKIELNKSMGISLGVKGSDQHLTDHQGLAYTYSATLSRPHLPTWKVLEGNEVISEPSTQADLREPLAGGFSTQRLQLFRPSRSREGQSCPFPALQFGRV